MSVDFRDHRDDADMGDQFGSLGVGRTRKIKRKPHLSNLTIAHY